MRRAAALGLLLALALAGCQRVPDDPRRGAVATAHPLATRAAADVLRDGGNAVDAAVAAAFALAVVEPYSSGLGGGGFFVAHLEGPDRDLALDARETAPAAASRDMYLRDGAPVDSLSRDGALAVATPGLVPGLWELHHREGRLPWSRLVAPARDLARDGFPVDELLARRIRGHAERFDPAARAVFLPDGVPPETGAVLRQPDLAATLDRVARHGGDEFRTGATAQALAAAVREAGGLLSPADLAAYRPVWRDPLHGSYRGLHVVGMPPPSSGGLHLIQMLRMLEPAALPGPGHAHADAAHRLAAAMTCAYADRARWLGDPDQVDIPVARLLDPARLDSLMARVRPDARLTWADAGGLGSAVPEGDHTTHLSVLDLEGNAVAATLTINLSFGAGMVAAGTGVVLNDEMDDFAAAPGTPNAFGLVGAEANAVAPGKRPLSSMTPTILLRGDDDVAMVVGSPGGSRIITAVLQTVLNVVDFRMDARRALATPRIHNQGLPEVLFHEPGALAPQVAAELARRGHVLQERESMGNVQLIVVGEDGRVDAAADPRGVGAAQLVSRPLADGAPTARPAPAPGF